MADLSDEEQKQRKQRQKEGRERRERKRAENPNRQEKYEEEIKKLAHSIIKPLIDTKNALSDPKLTNDEKVDIALKNIKKLKDK